MRHPNKPATYADLEALPSNRVGEILAGELVSSPRPAFGHARATSVLGASLGAPFDFGSGGPGGWWILDEVELHLGLDVLVPDLSGWRREHMPKPPSASEPFITLAPDWVCEVLSPSTVRRDRMLKMPIYLRERVRHVWLLDPLSHALEVFRLDQNTWTLAGNYAGDERVCAEPFEAIELELATLWT